MDRLAHCPHNKGYAREGNYKSFQEIAVALNKSGVGIPTFPQVAQALFPLAQYDFSIRFICFICGKSMIC